MTRIVVGIDDSPGAGDALRWACAEARRRGATLSVIHCWSFPYTFISGLEPGITPDVVEVARSAAAEVLDSAIAALGEAASGIEVERRVVEGPAAPALLAAAEDADLLVVGSRGHGGFAGLLLGSVSQQCAHHSPCPLVIVPAAATRAHGED